MLLDEFDVDVAVAPDSIPAEPVVELVMPLSSLLICCCTAACADAIAAEVVDRTRLTSDWQVDCSI